MAWFALVLVVGWFLVTFVLRSLLQKRRTGDTGLRAGGLRATFGSLEWIAAWLLALALLAGLAAPIAEIAGLNPLIAQQGWRIIGATVAVVGIALTFVAQVQMGTEWRVGVDVEEQTGLVTGRAFALVRNPIFSAMILTAAGLTLLVLNWVSVAGFVALVAAIELQVRFVEEPHLRRLHGVAYADYEQRVGRLIPGLGRGPA